MCDDNGRILQVQSDIDEFGEHVLAGEAAGIVTEVITTSGNIPTLPVKPEQIMQLDFLRLPRCELTVRELPLTT